MVFARRAKCLFCSSWSTSARRFLTDACKVLILGDGYPGEGSFTGAERQALALSRALKLQCQGERPSAVVHHVLPQNRTGRMLVKALGDAHVSGLLPAALLLRALGYRVLPTTKSRSSLIALRGQNCFPDNVCLIVLAGTPQSGVGVAIREQVFPEAKLVQLLHPRHSRPVFDLVIAPEHDFGRDDLLRDQPNVLLVKGSLHDTDLNSFKPGAGVSARICSLQNPRVAVVLGGPRGFLSQLVSWSAPAAYSLAEKIAKSAEGTWSVIVCPSRRTPPSFLMHFCKHLQALFGAARVVTFEEGLKTEYLAALKLADAVLVSSDSVNMISEALSSGSIVYVDNARVYSARLERFREGLARDKLITILDENVKFNAEEKSYRKSSGIPEVQRAADRVRKILLQDTPRRPMFP